MNYKKTHYFYIDQEAIGYGQPVFIIAEAGVNHNGKLKLALELIDVAAAAGANCIKFQTFQGTDLVTEKGEMATYQKKNLGMEKSQREMLEEFSLSEKYYSKIITHCKKRQILFMSTPHGGFGSVNFLERFNVTAYKLGSGDLTNLPLLTHIASLGKPMIISTGMGTLVEIEKAVLAVEKTGNHHLALLHCTSNYPCALNEVNLAAMNTMMKRFNYPIGYSDHTVNSKVAEYAILLGASIIEKHITLDRNLPGPDQVNSLEPIELKKMIVAIRRIESLSSKERKIAITKIPQMVIGSKQKKPNALEKEIATHVRKSLVYSRKLSAGHVMNRGDLDIKRPALGVAPEYLYGIIGKRLIHNVQADALVKNQDFK